MKRVLLALLPFIIFGCAKVASSTVGLATGVGATAAKTTAGAAKTGLKVAISADSDDDGHHGHHDDNPRPFDESRDATLDVDAALAQAKITGKRVLLVLGGNWCHDSRGLAAKFQEPTLASLVENNYELVWIDVGHRDRNLHVPQRFGVLQIFGTPTVLILSPEGDLLNADTVHDWRTADSKPFDETFDYFHSFATSE